MPFSHQEVTSNYLPVFSFHLIRLQAEKSYKVMNAISKRTYSKFLVVNGKQLEIFLSGI